MEVINALHEMNGSNDEVMIYLLKYLEVSGSNGWSRGCIVK